MCAKLLLFTGLLVVTSIGRADGDCTLPPHPAHGHHQPQGGDCGGASQHAACYGTPGTLAPEEWLLVVRCDPGYQLSDPSVTDVPSVCSDGAWSIPQLPACVLPETVVTNTIPSVPTTPLTTTETPPFISSSTGCVVPNITGGATKFCSLEGGCDEECNFFNKRCHIHPGTRTTSSLKIACKDGYTYDKDYPLALCKNPIWLPPITPCIKTVVTNAIPSVPPTPLPTTETPPFISSSTGCVVPNITGGATKICSLKGGCDQDCDFFNKRCHIHPGTRTTSSVQIACKEGYIYDKDYPLALCSNRIWLPPITPCIKICLPPWSGELLLDCNYNNTEASCSSQNWRPGTWVSFKCKPGYSEFPGLKREGAYQKHIKCKPNGEWSDTLPNCKADCGVPRNITKYSATIVGGQEAQVGFFPWHAGLYYRKEVDGKVFWDQKCGGTLITKRVILTAAHCVFEVPKSNIQVALGKYYRSWDVAETTEEKRTISEIQISPYYAQKGLAFDIAVLLLSQDIKFGEYIMPACRDHDLSAAQLQKASMKLHVVGWGKTGPGNAPSSEILLHNTVAALSQKECKFLAPITISELDKFCSKKNNTDSTVQQGDSGGGVTAVYADGLHYVVGIVSAKAEAVSFFTNITWKTHFDWIQNQLKVWELCRDLD